MADEHPPAYYTDLTVAPHDTRHQNNRELPPQYYFAGEYDVVPTVRPDYMTSPRSIVATTVGREISERGSFTEIELRDLEAAARYLDQSGDGAVDRATKLRGFLIFFLCVVLALLMLGVIFGAVCFFFLIRRKIEKAVGA